MSIELGSEHSPSRGSVFSRWRSYRQIHRTLLVFLILITLFVLERYRLALTGTFTLPHRQHELEDGVPRSAQQQRSMAQAGNSTLGFHAIYYVNMKTRYDREDAMALQAYISGLDVQDFPAVEAEMIDPVGMPPTHRPAMLKVGEKGCWRAHANIWSEMVRKKLPPVLIMESDATWDINVRPIMSGVNENFIKFLKSINSTAVHDPSWGSPHNQHPLAEGPIPSPTPSPPPIDYDADDPWLSAHWDLFSLGQCFEHGQDKDIKLVYPDPRVPDGRDYWGVRLDHQRVIRKSGGITCTTAYAISHTGAAKLLLRGAVDLDNPVDLLMRRLTLSRDLVAYSVMPPVMAQWEYLHDIGMNERGAQSDINGGKHADTPFDAEMKGWDYANRTGSVWITKAHHRDVAFEKMALSVAWEQILGDAVLTNSWWDPNTGD
ncbi:hypothetical protein B0T25DRAFT_496397 [Lasiosphaeria hispida]|uniref:Glycosyl transferase family 25 domain-containing protein n=1 Tax=Lasiosphaeria hispida TaxID=260671 RepID=A0AAJ0HS84_9PEZI|nr:hypothetical protein B0T25DRAFT_496397 [Lasiosphaeria hispida]